MARTQHLRERCAPPLGAEPRAGRANKPGQKNQMDKPCNIFRRGGGGGRRAQGFVRDWLGACESVRLGGNMTRACWGLTFGSWGGTRTLRWVGGCVESRGWGGGAGGRCKGYAMGGCLTNGGRGEGALAKEHSRTFSQGFGAAPRRGKDMNR